MTYASLLFNNKDIIELDNIRHNITDEPVLLLKKEIIYPALFIE